jgi:hypothetical protein
MTDKLRESDEYKATVLIAAIEKQREKLDRYEAALREIAKGDCHLNGITGCKGWPLPRERWCGLCVAREALAAAQEGDRNG